MEFIISEQNVHHLEVIRNFHSTLKISRPRYSLRQLAKRLNISASGLSEILNRKKFISKSLANKLAVKLQLIGPEKEKFILSCLIDRTKNKSVKTLAKKKFERIITSTQKTKFFSEKNLEQLESWIQFTIMELITFKEFEGDLEWLSKKLGIGRSVAQLHITQLLELGWISKENDTYKMTFHYCESTQDIPSENIKKYHQSTLKKATESLNIQHPDLREFQSAIISFNATPENILSAKNEIRTFVDAFTDKYCNMEQKNEVYHLGLQFFPLTMK